MRNADAACRQLAEFQMKACSDCCFSNGGHLFVAASNNSIAVYNTYTCELTGTLRYASRIAWDASFETQSSVHLGGMISEGRSQPCTMADEILLLAEMS